VTGYATGAATPMGWEDSGPEQVAAAVYRIPLPMRDDGLRAVNVYAIEADVGLVLIDAGWALIESRKRLELSLGTLGYPIRTVRRILVTHAHRDHYTLGVVLRREFGCRLELGEGERPAIERLLATPTRLVEQVDQLRRAGAEALADAIAAKARSTVESDEWERPDAWLKAGYVDLGSRVLQVLHTPGHTQGHMVFIDAAAGLMFSGDHILPHITPSIGFEPGPTRNPLADYLASLDAVRQLPDMRMLPAHGPVRESVHARVDELVMHHDARLADTMRIVGESGSITALGVARQLTWTRRSRRLAELDEFNQMLAIIETAAHLDLLVSTGRLLGSADEIAHYALAAAAKRGSGE